MAYTRTGRPPGRPKTKEYVTLMARVPQDVADQAKRYAGLHRHTMSDVLRESLLLLLQEEGAYRPFMSDTKEAPEIVSDMNIAPVPVPPVQAAPGYDQTKYVLGRMCPRRHEYQGTGQTLLTIGKRRCLPCENAKKREKRQTTRA